MSHDSSDLPAGLTREVMCEQSLAGNMSVYHSGLISRIVGLFPTVPKASVCKQFAANVRGLICGPRQYD